MSPLTCDISHAKGHTFSSPVTYYQISHFTFEMSYLTCELFNWLLGFNWIKVCVGFEHRLLIYHICIQGKL